MHAAKQVISVAGVALALMVLSGCQSSGQKAETTVAGEDAVMCAKCETVWVRSPTQVGPPRGTATPLAYRSSKAMVCEDCESIVGTFFKTGKLEHTCPTCGNALRHCKRHD